MPQAPAPKQRLIPGHGHAGVEQLIGPTEKVVDGRRAVSLLQGAVCQLGQVPGRGRGMEVGPEAQVGVQQLRLGHHVERAAHGQDEVHRAQWLQSPADPGARPAHALGDDPQLAEVRREHRQHAVRLPQIQATEDDGLGLVEARARAHRSGTLRAMDIRVEFSQMVAEVEAEMTAILDEHRGPAAPLYEMLAYHLGIDGGGGTGGKRIRPLLGLLVYRALGGDYRRALPGAAAVELGHNFSLVHDDIQDGDRERRFRPTLWVRWGVPQAINAGDALFALSRLALYRLATDQNESDPDAPDARQILELMRIYDQTCLALCEGQYLDISFEGRLDVSVSEYLEMIELKTASLMAAGVEAAAILASQDPDVIAALRRFGDRLGLAFQMADDVKGAFWQESASGKAEAGDAPYRRLHAG